MKWQSIAADILKSLSNSGEIPSGILAGIKPDITRESDGITAFLSINNALRKSSYHPGWNKIWQGNTLYGWYGTTLTIEPLRLAALEITSLPDEGESFRQMLLNLYSGAASSPSGQPVRLFDELAFPLSSPLPKPSLALLHRLNLDRRDRPFIERWHWSGDSGIAFVSDGGRLQIRHELAWARSFESILTDDGALPPEFSSQIKRFSPDSREFVFNNITPDVELFTGKLSFFGLAKKTTGGFELSLPAGSFPFLATRIYS